MSFFRRLAFNMWYLRHPPWDSDIVPPELVDFIRTHQAGRALDVGCGSGTSSLALARAGWNVTGVDFVPHAIHTAKQKAKAAGLTIDFRVSNVTRLPPFPNPFDLVLDIGCFQGLDRQDKRNYVDFLNYILTPGGNWLLYGFFKLDGKPGPGLTAGEPVEIARHLILQWRKDGLDKKGRSSVWFLFQKPINAIDIGVPTLQTA